jgi:hypothetical protein
MFFIPRLSVKNFKPALLKTLADSSGKSKFRSLVIKQLEFNQVKGYLDQLDDWKAEGYLIFLNASRKNLYHPLLTIPAEIILRLGLDPQVLNPVTGTIYFNLIGDRFYLTRFKDVYSEGRGSKFNLASDKEPSWIDFDGNLYIHFRMKQYNLIFKLAELFTISMKGNILMPHYHLHKQIK